MTFASYARSRIGEYLLVVLASTCICIVGFNAFYLDGMEGRGLAAAGACAMLVAEIYLASYRRKWLAWGVVLYVVLLAVLVAACLTFSGGADPYADEEGNYLYFGLVVAFAATGAFALTRTVAGSAVFFMACAFTCSVIEAFYGTGELAASLAAVFASLALVVYRNFQTGLAKATAVHDAPRVRQAGFAVATGCVLTAVCVALAAWLFIIAPLGPDVVKVTLLTDYRRLPVVELRGVADEHPVFDLETTSDTVVDGFAYTTDDLVTGESDIVVDAEELAAWLNSNGGGGDLAQGVSDDSADAVDKESTQPEFTAWSYAETFPLAALVLAAVMAAVLLGLCIWAVMRLVRRRRLVRMLSEEPADQVVQLYRFILSRLGKLGLGQPRGMTLSEYAASYAPRMSTITAETGVPLAALTRTYERCVYGSETPTEDDIVPFVAYYLRFWKAARRYLGRARYFLKSFSL
ncbi:MAG: DUF4129 domain-containing protein [Eggerthellaceae bacterium]|nr:DUF4129 domain-containing protein [Eggerthellaceae bacterium]